MKIRLLISSVLFAFSLPVLAQEPKPLTLGEQLIVRAYAGQLEGLALTTVIKAKTLGIAVNDSTICVALAGAMAGEFVVKSKADGLNSQVANPERRLDVVAFNKPDSAEFAAQKFKHKDAIALAFGGQVSDEVNAREVKMLLADLAKEKYKGALFLHLTVFGKKWVEMAASEDKAIGDWLAAKDNIFALSINPKEKKGMINLVRYQDGKQMVRGVVFTTDMNSGFLDLFNRRLLK